MKHPEDMSQLYWIVLFLNFGCAVFWTSTGYCWSLAIRARITNVQSMNTYAPHVCSTCSTCWQIKHTSSTNPKHQPQTTIPKHPPDAPRRWPTPWSFSVAWRCVAPWLEPCALRSSGATPRERPGPRGCRPCVTWQAMAITGHQPTAGSRVVRWTNKGTSSHGNTHKHPWCIPQLDWMFMDVYGCFHAMRVVFWCTFILESLMLVLNWIGRIVLVVTTPSCVDGRLTETELKSVNNCYDL